MSGVKTLANCVGGKAKAVPVINIVALVCVVGVAVGIVALQVRDHPRFSRVDELQHFDYALKAPSAGVRVGEQYGSEAMRTVACRGIDLPGWAPGSPGLPECGDPWPDPTSSHSYGYNTAYLHTPVYYSLTAWGGEAVLRLPGVSSRLVAYRLVGAVWLAAGLAVLWYALGLLGLGLWGRAAAVGLLGVSPVVVHASAFLNPDATALLGGGAVLVALLKWESGRWPWWTVTVAATAAVWLKLTNAAAVGAAAVYLAYRMWQERDEEAFRQLRAKTRGRLLAASTAILATGASVLVWRVWQSHRQLVNEKDLPIHLDHRYDSFRWTSLDDQFRSVVTPFRDQWVPEVMPYEALIPLSGVADVGLLVLLGMAIAVTAVRSAGRALVGGVFAAMVGMGVVTMISFHLALGLDVPTPGRYGLALLPLAMAAIAPVLRRHVLIRAMVGALACAIAAMMLHGVLWFGPKHTMAIPPDDETTMGVWCSTTSSSYFWRWNEAGDNAVYRVSLDGWSWQEHEGTTLTLENQSADTEAMLHVQAGSAEAWDSGPSGSRTCRTAPNATGP